MASQQETRDAQPASGAAAADSQDDGAQPLPEGFDRRYTTRARPYSFFEAPTIVKRLFSRFPLRTECEERRPLILSPLGSGSRHHHHNHKKAGGTEAGQARGRRGSSGGRVHGGGAEATGSPRIQLWARTAHAGPDPTRPSYHAACLKYQTLLLAKGVDFEVVPVDQDGAPAGRLPFLYVSGSGSGSGGIVRADEIEEFLAIRDRKRGVAALADDEERCRQIEGLALLEQSVRPAWLFALYLTPENAGPLVGDLYVARATSSSIARQVMLRGIVADAREELSKYVPLVEAGVGPELNRRAGTALDELVRILGGRTFFSGRSAPGLLDAAVFSYTHLLLTHDFGGEIGWRDTQLRDEVRRRRELVRHEELVRRACFEGVVVEHETHEDDDEEEVQQEEHEDEQVETSYSEMDLGSKVMSFSEVETNFSSMHTSMTEVSESEARSMEASPAMDHSGLFG